jgi:hypothetical protein
MHAYVYEVPNNDDLEFTLELGSHWFLNNMLKL